KFFTDLAKAKSAVFYAAVALLGKHFIEAELQRLEQ
ncbi:MAG TPA: molecular chaperone TorD, partial [Methylophaga sp.]|nr:molecular chaperone TorD [Methylophaga sp.]